MGHMPIQGLEESGYKHRRTVHLDSDTPAHESMPGVGLGGGIVHLGPHKNGHAFDKRADR